MKNKGKLIVLEGSCDGIGKSTQYQKLYDRLINEGYEVIRHHFPSYETTQGAAVENYLQGNFGPIHELSPYFINSLYAHDRAVTWYSQLKKEYENGKVILLDRYTTSSLIYQTADIESLEKRQAIVDYLADFEYHKLLIAEPDLVIFLTMPFELATELRNRRQQNDGVINDIHESNLSFMKKVYDNSHFIAQHFGFEQVNCESENGIRGINDIHEEVYQKCLKVLKK